MLIARLTGRKLVTNSSHPETIKSEKRKALVLVVKLVIELGISGLS